MAGGGIKINNIKVSGGADGATFIPEVDEQGNLSWSNNKGYSNPPTVNIKGADGKDGKDGKDGLAGAKLVSQVLQGQDAQGGNIYKQTFSDGTEAYFTAPKGEDANLAEKGTSVTVGGVKQSTWDADTKLDKVTNKQILYGTNYHGEPAYWTFGGGATAYTLMYRSGDGTCSIVDPIQPLNITNKQYVDTGLDGKLDKVTTAYKIYGTDESGNQKAYQTGWSEGAIQLMDFARGGYDDNGDFNLFISGTYMVGIPKKPSHATPKKWVEDNFTVYKHLIQLNMGEGVIPHIFYVLSTRSTPYTNASELPKNELFIIVDDAFVEQVQFVKIYHDDVMGIQYDYNTGTWEKIDEAISSFFRIDSDTVTKA